MADNHEPTEATAAERLVRGILSGLYFCRPGYVEFFDHVTQLAEVTPAIMSKRVKDGKAEYVKFPVLVKVPVCVPYAQTLGLALTLPIRKGDDGWLIFSDRFLDDFLQNGAQQGTAKPEACGADNLTTEPRMHSLSDAWFLPGVITQPRKIPNWNNNALEIRNFNRECFISMGADKNITIQTTGNVRVIGATISLNE